MSLWAQSLASAYESADSETKKVQEVLRYLAMPVPRSWWEGCMRNETKIKNSAEIIYDICDGIELLKEWKNYALFVALAFTELDDNAPYKYSIEEYYNFADHILKSNPSVNALGGKVHAYLEGKRGGCETRGLE